MPDVKEIFRTTTDRVRPDPGFVYRQRQRQRRRDMRRRIGVYVVTATIVLAAAVAIEALRAPQRPADDTDITSTHVDGRPVHVAVGEGAVWLAGDSVSKVDPSTSEVVAAFPSTSRRSGSALAVGAGAAWVSGGAHDGELLRIDARSGGVTTIHAGGGYYDPYAVVVGAGSVWATNDRWKGGSLAQIDPSTTSDRVLRTHRIGHRPYGVAVLDGTVWVGTQAPRGEHILVGLDPTDGSRVASFPVEDPHVLVGGFGALWMPSTTTGEGAVVSRLDPSTGSILATVRIPTKVGAQAPGLGRIEIAIGEGTLWIAITDRYDDGGERGRILRVDPATNQVVGEVSLAGPARGMAVGEGAIWVVDGIGTLTRINPAAVA